MNSIFSKVVVALLAFPFVVYGVVWAVSEFKLGDVEHPPAFRHQIPIDSETIKRGRHIARTRGCFGCHGQQLEGRVFTEQWPWVEMAVAPNLVQFAKE